MDTITPEVVETMARAGCQAICFGVESGNQEILDLAKKRSDLQKVREAMRMTQAVGMSALASFIIGLPGETTETLRRTVAFAKQLRQEFGSLYGFHILSPFPGTEVRKRAADYGIAILSNDWRYYDANHVVACTEGAPPAAIQEVSDTHERTMKRYLDYQDWLHANGRLDGYEKTIYLRRQRQSLLWKLLRDDVIEGLPALGPDALGELESAVVEATGVPPELARSELARVLELGALVRRETPHGARFAWSE